MSTNGTEPAQGPAALTIDGKLRHVERVSARKASVAFGLIRAISGKIPELVNKWGSFQAEYESTHTTTVDRAMALLRYGPRPITDVNGVPLVYPDTITVDGDERPHPHAGEVVVAPSPLDAMTEEAWASQNNRMSLPRSPSMGESVAAIFPDALEVAEDHIYRLLALALMPNDEVKRRRKDGSIREELERQADELVDDAMVDELVELAVVFGEVLEEQFKTKLAALEGRVGNALRLIGLDPARWATQTPEEAPQTATIVSSGPADGSDSQPTTTPTSASDTDEPSDGSPTPSSTNPPTSSPPSVGASSSSE